MELEAEIYGRAKRSGPALQSWGWGVSEVQARSWLVRTPDASQPRDDGRRAWKLGAKFWGMRKIPVAAAEVGGIYGSFMFGRRL